MKKIQQKSKSAKNQPVRTKDEDEMQPPPPPPAPAPAPPAQAQKPKKKCKEGSKAKKAKNTEAEKKRPSTGEEAAGEQKNLTACVEAEAKGDQTRPSAAQDERKKSKTDGDEPCGACPDENQTSIMQHV